jgi:hypothetical protein
MSMRMSAVAGESRGCGEGWTIFTKAIKSVDC